MQTSAAPTGPTCETLGFDREAKCGIKRFLVREGSCRSVDRPRLLTEGASFFANI